MGRTRLPYPPEFREQMEALAMLSELQQEAKTRYVAPSEFAIIYTGLGETDAAFEALDRSLKEGDATLIWRFHTPGFAELRSDPRFDTLRSALGLSE